MSSRKRSSKPKPISLLIKPIIDQIQEGKNEAYRINVTHFPPQRQQRIYHAFKNAIKSNNLDYWYDIEIRKGIIYLEFKA